MGCGSWKIGDFRDYSARTKKGAVIDSVTGKLIGDGVSSNQEIYKETQLHPSLKPFKIKRECIDTEEHPETIPVILGLDVTGSMGDAAVEVAKSLNVIMTDLYKNVKDVEFCIMGIGDLYCDSAPIQMSQFESDIRIAEHLDKVYFEFGGGGNNYESYSAAWYMGLHHTVLDCWKRNKKGIIITIGDENMNPYLSAGVLHGLTGDNLQCDVETKPLYDEAKEKFDIFHIHVNHDTYSKCREMNARATFSDVIGKDHFFTEGLNTLTDRITEIVTNCANNMFSETTKQDNDGMISW